jgi:hypothetical protein
VTPTLTARSSEWTAISIIRVIKKSDRESDQPVHGMNTARSAGSAGREAASDETMASTCSASESGPPAAMRSPFSRVSTLTGASRPASIQATCA